MKCIQHSNFCIPHLIEKIHFDPKKPENHNIYISNLKNNYTMVYDGDKWTIRDRDDSIQNLMELFLSNAVAGLILNPISIYSDFFIVLKSIASSSH